MASDAAKRLGIEFEEDTSPQDALLQDLRRARGAVAYLESRAAKGEIEYVDPESGALTGWWTVLKDRQAQAIKIEVECERLGLLKRRQELEEADTQQVARLVVSAFEDVGVALTPEVMATVAKRFGLAEVSGVRPALPETVDGSAEAMS